MFHPPHPNHAVVDDLMSITYQYYDDQADERQASEDGLLRVLLEPHHDPELCEAQLARIPKDHEEV